MRTLIDRAREAAARQISKAEIGELAGVTRQASGKWADGGNIKAKHLFKLADALGVEGRWLFEEIGPKKAQAKDTIAQILWDLWAQLDDDAKRDIVGFARVLASKPPGEDGLPSPKSARRRP